MALKTQPAARRVLFFRNFSRHAEAPVPPDHLTPVSLSA